MEEKWKNVQLYELRLLGELHEKSRKTPYTKLGVTPGVLRNNHGGNKNSLHSVAMLL